jgi:glycosyltransferase involved in cell wall biosynthesis
MGLVFAFRLRSAIDAGNRGNHSMKWSGKMSDTASQIHLAARREIHRPLTILYHHRTRARDGQSVHIDALIDALRAAHHEIVVVGPKRVPATVESLNRKVLPKFIYEILEFGYNFLELAKLTQAVLRHRPDALYQRANVFMLSGAWIARFFKLPFLLEVNAPLTIERSKFGGLSLSSFAGWTEHAAWRAADYVLTVTAVLARTVEKASVPRSRIVVMPNGVDLDKLKSIATDAAKARLGLGTDLVVGFVGFVRDWHGLEKIVDLLAFETSLSTARFLVVGDGPACESLRERARETGVADRLIITGVLAHEHLPAYVSAMDIALQPEVTPYASPLKLFEYMALGRAIIAPDVENIREVLEHEVDSLLFDPGDRAALANAIRRLAGDEKLRTRLGTAAAAEIATKDLTWRGNAKRVAVLIEDCSNR